MTLLYQEGVSLSEHTTLKVGGEARYFVEVNSVDDLREAVRFAQQNELPFLVIGGGSNILVADEGYPGVVIKMSIKERTYTPGKNEAMLCTYGAGEVFDDVVAETVERGYFGLENLSAIPGNVGATPVQNVGAYGVEVKDLIVSVDVYDTLTHEVKTLKNEQCRFTYRHSIFKMDEGKHYIVTSVTFNLATKSIPKIDYTDLKSVFIDNNNPTVSEVREAIIKIRANKFPDWRTVGTAGSFFKNPVISNTEALALRAKYVGLPIYEVDGVYVKISLGYILDKVCHFKGYRKGDVGLYEKQALVLVNYGKATSSDILSFAFMVTSQVEEVTGIRIEPEVRYIK